MKLGTIVVLNGTPRSGKSSIVREIQTTFDGVWINLGVDRSMAATPERYRPGIGLRPGGERPDLEPVVASLYRALYDSVAAHSRQGLNVVVDVGHHEAYSQKLGTLPDAARRLSGLPALLVGVRCPQSIVMERRQATGMSAPLEMVERWERAVHEPGTYDFEVDTSVLSSAECAEAIRRRLDNGPAPEALSATCLQSPLTPR